MTVAIVGAGITGLTAAYYLERSALQQGWDLSGWAIDSERRPGGKIRTESVDGFIVEGGPDSFLAQKPWARQLVEDLGMEKDLITPEAHGVWVLRRGRLHPIPDGLLGPAPRQPRSLWNASFLSRRAKVRASLEALVPARLTNEDESINSFLRRRLGQEWTRILGEPLMAGIHAGNGEHLSMQALYPTLLGWEQQHGSLTRGLSEAKAAARSGPPSPMFLALREGMEALPQAIIKRLRLLQPILGVSVDQLELGQDVVNGKPPYRIRLGNGQFIEAQYVILASPAYVSAALLHTMAPKASATLASLPYASTASISLAYPVEAVSNPLEGTGFIVPRNESFPLTACTWVSSKWPARSKQGAVLLRGFIGWTGDQSFLDCDDDALVEGMRKGLEPLLGIKGAPQRAWVHRWPRALPQYNLGHLDWLRSLDMALAPFPNLILAGAAYRGLGVPDCIRQGKEAAARVTQRVTEAGMP